MLQFIIVHEIANFSISFCILISHSEALPRLVKDKITRKKICLVNSVNNIHDNEDILLFMQKKNIESNISNTFWNGLTVNPYL